jgi:hypothetical protein
MAPPRFVEEAQAAGISHRYDGEFLFFVGGGVAVFDCNADGRPDLYFAGGENPAALYRNQSSNGGPLRFEAVSSPAANLSQVTGAYPVDIDSDGRMDLAVPRVGENVVLRGLGDCGFERANEAWSIDGGDAWTVAFSATWEDEAELPTLAFGNYVALDSDGNTTDTCADHALIRPDAPAGYAAATSLTPGLCTLSVLFSDWDRSGRRDLRITNDRHFYRVGEEQPVAGGGGSASRLYTHDEVARAPSGAWASPATTSPATVCPKCSSPARPTTSCRLSPTVLHNPGMKTSPYQPEPSPPAPS